MLPFFFRHYDPVVDRYYVYDNGSTDDSLALLARHPKVSIRHFSVSGGSFVEEERLLSDTIWRQSRGAADWVIVLDIDEHVFHPDLPGYLRDCTQSGITALRTIGYEMVADRFPEPDVALVDSVTIGARSAGHDKLCIFNPDAMVHTHFRPGRHLADPEGRLIWPVRPHILMLHYKQLGVEYAIRRSAELRLGLGPGDMEQQWGVQYMWSAAEIAERWAKLRAVALPVPGLGTRKHVAPEFFDEEHVVSSSGLLDPAWYLAQYPDVAAAGMSALSHFCIHGWKEGRGPNFYFQPSWYLQRYPAVAARGENPLTHYILTGEASGAQPSPNFDAVWYRERYGLGAEVSPLKHYLEHRHEGGFSPLPEFDVADYVARHPERLSGFADPYEEYCWRASVPPPSLDIPASMPAYSAVIATLGVDPHRQPGPVSIDSAALLEVFKLFLQVAVVDEERYLRTYPDVAAAMEDGTVFSARQHFIESGYFEGRDPSPDVPPER
jgi:hypothetical protein